MSACGKCGYIRAEESHRCNPPDYTPHAHLDQKPLASLRTSTMSIQFIHANVSKPERIGHYILGESDRYSVFKHVGDQDGYSRITATMNPFTLIYDGEGKLKEKDTIWLTPNLVKGPVADIEHCLEIWLRETVLVSPEVAARWVPWLVEALMRGKDL